MASEGRAEGEEVRLAPRDACGMLTAGRKNSAIQSACLPRAPAWAWEGICQVRAAANDSGGASNTDKESQVFRMRADLDSGSRGDLLRVLEKPAGAFATDVPPLRPPLSVVH